MDKASIVKALRDTAQAASNTAASTVSGPLDLIAAALRYGGVPVPENAFGGSKWMAERGLTQEVEQGVPRVVGETLGMVGPALATQFAPQIASVVNRAVDNAMAPTKLSKQAGVVRVQGPQAEALETARKNAVEMLGLPENNTPMDRAKALGFVDDVFFGSPNAPIEKIRGDLFTSSNPAVASTYAIGRPVAGTGVGRTTAQRSVMPLMVRQGDDFTVNAGGANWDAVPADLYGDGKRFGFIPAASTDEIAKFAKEQGKSTARIQNVLDIGSGTNPRNAKKRAEMLGDTVAVLDPTRVRSRFAAFDPARINENDLLGRADPRLLGLLGLGTLGGVGAYNYLQAE